MSLNYATLPTSAQRGATSLLEILFVLVVVCAFAIGLYRQFSIADIEKSALNLNDQLAGVAKIANAFYFSVDPQTKDDNPPIRFCNQNGASGSTRNVFNSYTTVYEAVDRFICPSNTSTACSTLRKIATTLGSVPIKHKNVWFIILGQKDPVLGTPKFIGLFLLSFQPPAKNDITNEATFKLYKGKLAGNPQYVPAKTNPLNYFKISMFGSYGGLFWIIPPSQGDLTLLSGAKLSNANMSALNELAGVMSARKPLPTDNYVLSCQNTYKPPPSSP